MNQRYHSLKASARWGVFLSTGIVTYALIAHFGLKPLHSQEQGQAVIGFLNGLDHVFQAPGLKLAIRVGILRSGGHMPFATWLKAVVLNALFYFAAGLLLRWMWIWGKGSEGDLKQQGDKAMQGVKGRRRFLIGGMKLASGGVFAGLGYSLVVESRWFEITRRIFPMKNLPIPLDGLRIVQLTDIHHGPWLSRGYVREVIQAANDLEPDLFVLTGDYVHQSPAYIEPVVQEMCKLRPKIGTVAVLGNHDWWEDGELVRREFAGVGIRLLDNTRCILTPDRRLVSDANEGLAIAGVGDLWEDKPDYQAALGGLPEDMPRLLLSHNPDVAEQHQFTRSGHRVDLMLSGHTHGGQVFIPFLGTPILPSLYGQKYAQGLVQGPVCPVYICRGIGMTVLPLRLGVKPEIAMVEFQIAY